LVISMSFMFLLVLSPPVSRCLMTETPHIWVQSKHVCDCLFIQNCSSVFSTIHHCCCRCFQFFLLTDVLLDSDICITLFHHLPISIHVALFCKGWKSCECLWRDSHGCDDVCVKHMKLSHTHTHTHMCMHESFSFFLVNKWFTLLWRNYTQHCIFLCMYKNKINL
jgi:hypothetical protein